MKCIDCPIMKYDGKNYVCPAHPYAEGFDMYTEHEGCTARNWYQKSLVDRKNSLGRCLFQLRRGLPILETALETLKTREGYGKKLFDELMFLHKKYVDRYKFIDKELTSVLEELCRIGSEPCKD